MALAKPVSRARDGLYDRSPSCDGMGSGNRELDCDHESKPDDRIGRETYCVLLQVEMAEDGAPPPAHTWSPLLVRGLTRELFEHFEEPTEAIIISQSKVVFFFGQNRMGLT